MSQKSPISLRLSDPAEAWLRAYCKAIGRPVNAVLAELVDQERIRVETQEGITQNDQQASTNHG